MSFKKIPLLFVLLFVAPASGADAPLARWSFDADQPGLYKDTTGHGYDAKGTNAGATLQAGPFGKYLNFTGNYVLPLVKKEGFAKLEKITLTAWVRPTHFDAYNEIFRKEDGDNRILFSFQERGSILSLGININGAYTECDAPISPALLSDGSWHHVAATYDGREMVCYLNGSPVHRLAISGRIQAKDTATPYIGSSAGGHEFLRGGLDELTLYSKALKAEQIKEAFVLQAKNLPHKTQLSNALFLTLDELFTLYLEYKPITPAQWKNCSPEERTYWKKAEQQQATYLAIKKQKKADKASEAALHDLIAKITPLIKRRPVRQEAVAPYIPPATPKTEQLTTDEAKVMLEKDWLYQADGKPTKERTELEIGWARTMAKRIAGNKKPVDFSKQLAKLDTIAKEVAELPANTVNAELYLAVRRVKREIQLANPVINFKELLFVDMPYPAGNEWRHETRHRLDYMAVPGARLLVLEGLNPGSPIRKLMPQEPLHGSFWRPDVSYNGKKVLFCFKPHNEKSFHLYEIDADGKNLRQLTYGPYSDIDPIYLPDSKIIFSTTRGNTYVRCMPPTNAFPIARCDADGKNIYILSRNNEPDYLPSVMQDGTVLFTRWEYTDKPLWRAQSLWVMNPDGTQVNTFWGNQSVWPDLLKDARQIPGSEKIMFVGSAHHNWFAGSVGIIDQSKGLNFPDGLTKVTAERVWPESGNGPVDPVESENYHTAGRFRAYYSPYPLSEQDFLVSANRGNKFILYLMDTDGNRELIYEGAHNIFHAMPLAARPKPPVLPSRVIWPTRETRENPAPGIIFSNNVYEGVPEKLVGKAKYLRVMNIEHKTYTYWHKRPYASTGPVVSMVQSEGVKKIIGTVEIEKDGSVSFEAPSGIPLHFQLLDENYCALQTMRSFTGVMPGESRGCVGCHALRNNAAVTTAKNSIALTKSPRKITPPPWDDHSISYFRYVRPTLDKYCGKCHMGEGKGRKKFDMTERRGVSVFSEPYVTIIGAPTWGRAYKPPTDPRPGFNIANTLLIEGYHTLDPAAYITPEPMTKMSYNSPLIKIASSGKHNDVKVDPVALRRLKVWVDAMCPYRGSEEVRALPDPDFQGIDWLSVRPKVKSAPRIVRPGPVD